MVASEHVSILETPISNEEIVQAIDSLKSNRSLGPDGLMAEFYKNFKFSLLPYLQNLFLR